MGGECCGGGRESYSLRLASGMLLEARLAQKCARGGVPFDGLGEFVYQLDMFTNNCNERVYVFEDRAVGTWHTT